jgi:hypothetical protein
MRMLLGWFVVLGFATWACAKKDSPAPLALADAGSNSGKASGTAWEVTLSGPDSLGVEKSSSLIWELKARPGFHVNAEYPVSFKPDKALKGVAFEQDKYDLKTISDPTPCANNDKDVCTIKAHIPFKTVSVGNHQIGGTFAFSVCNEDQCLIEKVPLSRTLRSE